MISHILLTDILWVILIVVPNSTEDSTYPRSFKLFRYSVTLSYKAQMISHLPTQVHNPKRITNRRYTKPSISTLSYFRSLFIPTIGGGRVLCRTSLLCTIYSLLKNLLGNLYNLHSVGIFTTPMFYKYTIIFFNYQIFLKLFFNPIARVSFITYKVLHPLINVIYERFFKRPNLFEKFIRISGFVCIHTFGFINVGFNSNKLKIR